MFSSPLSKFPLSILFFTHGILFPSFATRNCLLFHHFFFFLPIPSPLEIGHSLILCLIREIEFTNV